jgi:uncharacterized protein YndB with AHSA1/START domain
MTRTLAATADFELPRVIVWDALVDPVLLEGWAGNARVEAAEGGAYEVTWGDGSGTLTGVIARWEPPGLLQVQVDTGGELRYELEPLDGGLRGSSTRLRIIVDGARDELWRVRLDNLAQLLRGHPVVW